MELKQEKDYFRLFLTNFRPFLTIFCPPRLIWSRPAYVVILRQMDHLYSLWRGYGAKTRERLFSSVLDQFSSVLDHILPSQIDMVKTSLRSNTKANGPLIQSMEGLWS